MLRKVRNVDLTIHTDIPHQGEECSLGFSVEGGFSVEAGGMLAGSSHGRSMNFAKGSAILQAVAYADEVAFEDATGALHVIFKETPVQPFQPLGQ
jgi:hypothetical protein